jgi:hypothetical protein
LIFWMFGVASGRTERHGTNLPTSCLSVGTKTLFWKCGLRIPFRTLAILPDAFSRPPWSLREYSWTEGGLDTMRLAQMNVPFMNKTTPISSLKLTSILRDSNLFLLLCVCLCVFVNVQSIFVSNLTLSSYHNLSKYIKFLTVCEARSHLPPSIIFRAPQGWLNYIISYFFAGTTKDWFQIIGRHATYFVVANTWKVIIFKIQ